MPKELDGKKKPGEKIIEQEKKVTANAGLKQSLKGMTFTEGNAMLTPGKDPEVGKKGDKPKEKELEETMTKPSESAPKEKGLSKAGKEIMSGLEQSTFALNAVQHGTKAPQVRAEEFIAAFAYAGVPPALKSVASQAAKVALGMGALPAGKKELKAKESLDHSAALSERAMLLKNERQWLKNSGTLKERIGNKLSMVGTGWKMGLAGDRRRVLSGKDERKETIAQYQERCAASVRHLIQSFVQQYQFFLAEALQKHGDVIDEPRFLAAIPSSLGCIRWDPALDDKIREDDNEINAQQEFDINRTM